MQAQNPHLQTQSVSPNANTGILGGLKDIGSATSAGRGLYSLFGGGRGAADTAGLAGNEGNIGLVGDTAGADLGGAGSGFWGGVGDTATSAMEGIGGAATGAMEGIGGAMEGLGAAEAGGGALASIAEFLPFLLLNRGGRVNPYADGGEVDDSPASFSDRFGDMPPAEGSGASSWIEKTSRALGVRPPEEVANESLGETLGRGLSTGLNALGPRGGVRAAPQSMTPMQGLASTVGLTSQFSPDSAHAEGVSVEPTASERAEISRIQGEITKRRTDLERAIKRNPEGNPVKAHKLSIDALTNELEKIQGPQSPLGMRRAAALELERAAAERRARAGEELSSRQTESELPYAVKYPERQAWLQKNMPTISAGTGAALGLLGKGKILKPLAASALAGGAEGAVTAAWPTLQDTEFLPPGQTWQQAADRLRNADPDFLTRIGAASGAHAALAGGASLLGSKVRDAGGQLKEFFSRTPSAAPQATQAASQMAAQRVKMTPTDVKLPDGSVAQKYTNGNRVMWKQNGKFIKAPEGFAVGGTVSSNPYGIEGYADGGDADSFDDRFGMWDKTNEAYGRKLSGNMSGFVPASDTEIPSEARPASGPAPSNPYINQESPDRALAFAAPTARPASRESGMIDSPWAALMQAGLGTMAAAGQRDARGLPTSPLAAIGQGGQKGFEALRQQQEARLKQQTVEQAARRLDTEAARHAAEMAQKERFHNTPSAYQAQTLDVHKQQLKAAEDYRKERLEQGNFTNSGAVTAEGHPVLFNRKTGQSVDGVTLKPIDPDQKITGAKAAMKPLPTGIQKDLGEKAQTFQQLKSLSSGFKPEYSGWGSETAGNISNWAARQLGMGNVAAAEWWQEYQTYKSNVRHKLYGSALTAYEIAEWQKQDINPGMPPEVIERNIKRQNSIIEGAMKRRADSLVKQGFSQEAVEAEIGHTFGELGVGKAKEQGEASTSESKPTHVSEQKVGERKQFKQGWGVWDGSKWIPAKD
jgi:hypothetical protein